MSVDLDLASEIARQVLEHLPQTSVVVFDRDLRFSLVAGPALADAGLDRDKVEGRRLEEVVPPAVGEYLGGQYRRALAGDAVSMRYRSTLSDRVFWLRILPLQRTGDTVETAMAVTLDITDLAEAEARIRETVRALDDAQRIARVGSWSWDPREGRVEWSAETYRILGLDPAGGPAMGRELLELAVPEDREALAAGFRTLLAGTGDEVRLQLRIRHSEAAPDVLWLLLIGHGASQPGGSVVGTVQDVTELRQAELEATRQRDYVQAIIAATDEGILLSEEGRIVDVNPAMCRLVGHTREELIGLSAPYPFWSPRAVGELAAHLTSVSSPGQTAEIESFLRDRSGQELPVAITTVMAAHHPGEPVTQVSTVRDITRQKRNEAELRGLAALDPLTGLLNQRGFREHIEREMARSRLHEQPLSLALMDLDHFKQINDRHGHPTGDMVLKEFARRLRSLVRKDESIARVGGEEFGWILPNAAESSAFGAAERARKLIAADPFPVVGQVTVSVGVCQLDQGADADQLYSCADLALYQAKQRGRNRTERHSQT